MKWWTDRFGISHPRVIAFGVYLNRRARRRSYLSFGKVRAKAYDDPPDNIREQ